MNKIGMVSIVGLALAATAAVPAAETAGQKMEMTKTPASVNHTKGLVKELDAKKGIVTLAHEAVPTLNWPAMTMGFKISSELAKGIEVGQTVQFEFEAKGMVGTITRIAPVR